MMQIHIFYRIIIKTYFVVLFAQIIGCESKPKAIKIFENDELKSISNDIPSKGEDALQNWLKDRMRVTEKGHSFTAGSGFLDISVVLYSDNPGNEGISKVFVRKGEGVEVSNFRAYIFNQDVDAASKLNGVTHSFVLKFQADAARIIDSKGTSDWFNITRAHFLDPIILVQKNDKWVVEIPQGTGSGLSSNQWDALESTKSPSAD